jgi:S1-C subfamily serine protease
VGVDGFVILRVPSSSAAAVLKGVKITRNGSVFPGDIIIAVEGKPVDSVSKLVARMDDFRVGDQVRLSLIRNGKKAEARVTLQPGN